MSASAIRQPGDIVNEVYSQHIKSIIQLCLNAGDDPNPLVEQVKCEIQVKLLKHMHRMI